MKTFTFEFEIRQRVKIKELENGHGVVETMSVTVDGLSYRVAYWHNGERHTTWLMGDEIE